MGAVNWILFAIDKQLQARRRQQINLQFVAELQQIQQHIRRLSRNLGLLGRGEIAALLFGQPLKVLKQLRRLYVQRRSQVFGRMKLLPITRSGEVTQGLGQGLKIVVHAPIVFHLSALIIRRMKLKRRTCISALLATALPGLQAQAQTPGSAVLDETWLDAARQRELPVKLRWPDAATHPGPHPVVLFSHGLGGTREGGAVWGEAWAAAGFVVLHLQHAGSDLAAVRAQTNTFTDKQALRSAAGPAQLLARLHDVTFALDEIGRRHAARQERWGTVRPAQVGMSGHSFGAHTTLGMAGQRYPGFEGITEPRLASFIAFSPSLPAVGDAKRAFDRMTRPLLCFTGTRDSDVAGVGATPERRAAVFDALSAGDKAQLVLQDADHMSFAGQLGRAVEIVPREAVTRDLQAAHHALVASISTDWWRATLLGDPAARSRLAAPPGLRQGDIWQQK